MKLRVILGKGLIKNSLYGHPVEKLKAMALADRSVEKGEAIIMRSNVSLADTSPRAHSPLAESFLITAVGTD